MSDKDEKGLCASVNGMHPETLKLLVAAVVNEHKTIAPKSEELHTPWWIKVFGSALVVIIFSVIGGAFQQCFSNINELRSYQEKFVKLEEYNSRMSSQWATIKEVQTNQTKMAGLEERVKTAEAQVKKLESDLQTAKDEASKLRERVTVLEKAKPTPPTD